MASEHAEFVLLLSQGTLVGHLIRGCMTTVGALTADSNAAPVLLQRQYCGVNLQQHTSRQRIGSVRFRTPTLKSYQRPEKGRSAIRASMYLESFFSCCSLRRFWPDNIADHLLATSLSPDCSAFMCCLRISPSENLRDP